MPPRMAASSSFSPSPAVRASGACWLLLSLSLVLMAMVVPRQPYAARACQKSQRQTDEHGCGAGWHAQSSCTGQAPDSPLWPAWST